MSIIELDDQFTLKRADKRERFYLENHCNKCGWIGKRRYAYDDYQHFHCKFERQEHRKACRKSKIQGGLSRHD